MFMLRWNMTKKEITALLKHQRTEDMKVLLLEFRKDNDKNRKVDRKYLDKKLKEQTHEVNKLLGKQDLERARILSKNKQETIDAVEKSNFGHRSDFYTKIDPILKEVTTQREHRIIITEQVSGNSDRLDKVEQKLQITT